MEEALFEKKIIVMKWNSSMKALLSIREESVVSTITQTNLVFVYRAGRVCYSSSLPFLMPSDFTALHGAIQYSMNFTQWMTALLD